ncbi:MAG TPA: hypothetical protein VFO14_19125 [Vicinamibacterales bacterium]|nr:hypothetical protein [Vicinamibacterales bacterium]
MKIDVDGPGSDPKEQATALERTLNGSTGASSPRVRARRLSSDG